MKGLGGGGNAQARERTQKKSGFSVSNRFITLHLDSDSWINILSMLSPKYAPLFQSGLPPGKCG